MRTENKKLVAIMAVSSNDETKISARLPHPRFVERVAGLNACNTGATGWVSMKGMVIAAGAICSGGFEIPGLLLNMLGICEKSDGERFITSSMSRNAM